jgi:LuxR family transcriptional regulator, maltose regulon positive regulatory protein
MRKVRGSSITSGTHPPSVVARPELFDRLSAGFAGGVTVVSAPPGSGKTVLLHSWIDEANLADRAAWVSVRRDEQDPQRFWLSVLEQLRAAVGSDAVLAPLAPSPQFDGAGLVQRLIAQLAGLDRPILLVIDDLHELRAASARDDIAELIAGRPEQLCVLLATRHDPQLGLHRLRLTGQLTEIREAELRFNLAETQKLLEAARVRLDDDSLSLLHGRTEGWAAGLRLAALSLAGHPDPRRFVAEFSGNERTVADYLLAEVLANLPADVRRLLLRTSILDNVTGPLADHLLGSTGSERILLWLEDENYFVVAVDAARTTFRYHHLLADLLRLELRRTSPEDVPQLHLAAAEWYVAHDNVLEAVRHAARSEAWDYAGRLLAEHGLTLSLDGQGAAVDRLLAALPADVRREPELAAFMAYQELSAHSLGTAASYIALAERHSDEVPPDRRAHFGLNLALARLALARRRGDDASVLAEVRTLLEPAARTFDGTLLGDDARAAALMNLGIVELWSRRPDEAERDLEHALELARRAGRPYLEIGCLSHIALLPTRPLTRQRPVTAEAVAIAERHGWETEPIACMALATMAAVDVAQGRIAEGGEWLDRAERALRTEVEPATALFLFLVRGIQRLGEGQLNEAAGVFAAAERTQASLVTMHVNTALVRNFLVQTQLRMGQREAARATLARVGQEQLDWGETRCAAAAIHLADEDASSAIEVLAPVLSGEASVIRVFTLVQALLLDALAREQLGQAAAAEADVERALKLTEADAVVIPFLVTPVQDLLDRHPRHRTAHATLLTDIRGMFAGSPPARLGELAALAEPLSESELRVLRYLPSNLSAPDIAVELFVSTSTVKTHMRHVYEKLGVHRRTEAVERARDLGLLAAATRRRG